MSGFKLLSLAWLLPVVFLLGGCLEESRELSIPPRTEPQDQANVGLGPGVRPLSSGPGEKGSPAWSPSGGRIAFIVDDYVVDKPLDERDFRRRTTKDFNAETVTWLSSGAPAGDSLAILGTNSRSGSGGSSSAPLNLYETPATEGTLEVTRIETGARTMASAPNSREVFLALSDAGSGSQLATLDHEGEVRRYDARIEGDITGLSVSADGNQAVLAVRNGAPSGRSELYTFSLPRGVLEPLVELEDGIEILGNPQWTENGIYYVAGEEQEAAAAAPYDLYRIPPGASVPEPVSGIGNDFVTSNLERDPQGGRLAVIGRRNPGSPQNLYVLDLVTKDLESVTSNENMEIKTGAEDLAWSADGNSIAIVARSLLSEPKVYSARSEALVTDFYNLHQVPVGALKEPGAS
ncbi:MAG: TolB family protein [Rubrobacteraceae bacterium]